MLTDLPHVFVGGAGVSLFLIGLSFSARLCGVVGACGQGSDNGTITQPRELRESCSRNTART